MAAQLKLVRLDDFGADIDSVNLLTGGFSLAGNGYAPVVAPIGAKSVQESITLNLKGTSIDDLASMVQDIDRKIEECQWWIDDAGVERYQVWLRVQMDGETYARQAQLLNIMPSNKVIEFPTWDTSDYSITEYQFGIERTPFWEAPYPYPTTVTKTGLSSCGGMAELNEIINGDVPARLAVLSPTPNGAAQMGEFWIGWKSNRFGNPANFQPVWSLDKSVYRDTDTSIVADVTAVDGNKITCTFGTVATLVQRTITQISDVISDSAKYADQRGSYLVLLRAKMSDGTSTARARMLYSFSNTAQMKAPVYRSLQIISNPVIAFAKWKLYPMGIAAIPSMRIARNISLQVAAISIQAERIAGAGNLELDCLVLIPIDDGAVHIASASTDNMTNGFYSHVFQYADGSIGTYGASSAFAQRPTVAEPINYNGLVATDSRPYIVVAGQKYISTTTDNTFTDLIDVGYTYIPRWRTLRGGVYGSGGT